MAKTNPLENAIGDLTEKTTPASGDFFIIEDNASGGELKKVDAQNVGGSGGVSARAYLGASQVIGISWTKLQLNTESYDSGGNYDNVTNYRFTAPTSGKYMVSAQVYFPFINNSASEVAIYVNGVEHTLVTHDWTDNTQVTHTVVDIIDMASGDYIELYAKGGASITASSGSSKTFMAIHQLS